MTTQLVDFYHDPDKVVFEHIRQTRTLPPFVVAHRAMSEDELKKLDAREFADASHRMFPVCSAAETWTSIAYFNVLKQALLSAESAAGREDIRTMLSKAASLWGLNDDEVQELAKNVTLGIPKKAEAEVTPSEQVKRFLANAPVIPVMTRKEEAEVLLKAAETELDPDTRTQLMVHAGAATCTAGEAQAVLTKVIPQVPFRSEYRPILQALRESLNHQASSDLLDPDDATNLMACLEKVTQQYHIRKAHIEDLRSFTMGDAVALQKEAEDSVRLPGGIFAKKSAISENASQLSIHLSNIHSVDAHRPEEILAALQKLSPTEILPFRPLIGA